MRIEIRRATTLDECKQTVAITEAAWGSPREIAPSLLLTMAKNQGVVLLAWDGPQAVGFCFSFVSFVDGPRGRTLKHCSHMTGVRPEYQNRAVGERLKWAQRAAILEQGITHVTWTYDPLETRNGRLNIHKLGATCQTYVENAYGTMNDKLNAGLPSDRFQVDWRLDSARVAERAATRPPSRTAADVALPAANPPRRGPDGIWRPDAAAELPDGNSCVLLLPADFQATKRADGAAALAWRLHTRAAFNAAFAAGFVATDLLADGGDGLCGYLLERESAAAAA